MKKQVLYYLAMASIAILVALTSCEKEDLISYKLLDTTTYAGGYSKFEYDKHNRITKVSRYDSGRNQLESTDSYIYKGEELVKIVRDAFDFQENNAILDFTKKGNKITIKDGLPSTFTIDIDENDLPIKVEFISEDGSSVSTYNFTYQNGNPTKCDYSITEVFDNIVLIGELFQERAFDNNKTPLYHCKTPKWFLYWYFLGESGQNNMTERKNSNNYQYTSFEYVYDHDGFPVKRTETLQNLDETFVSVTEFTYK
jgi:hypothetical protein